MTLKLGIVGTNWISKLFVEAIQTLPEKYTFSAVYSRQQATGTAFAAELGQPDVAVYDDYEAFLTNADLDVVYIASPNSLHFAQAQQALAQDLHVIVEKSIVSNPAEFEKLYEMLRRHPKARLFEAARHIHQANFKALEKQVAALPAISGGTFVFEKYSSRFDDYLAGKEPNVLTREYSAGALTDLGVYPLYTIIKLFGLPETQTYYATKLANGADGRGTAILRYPQFDLTLQCGKMTTSYAPTEIMSGRATVVVDNIAELGSVKLLDGQGGETLLSTPAPANPMIAEAEVFFEMMTEPDATKAAYRELLLLSQRVNLVLTALRQSADIVFPADR